MSPLADLTHADAAFAGHKGAGLGELTRAGFPVPPGFVIGTSAWVRVCDAGCLVERIGAVLEPVDINDLIRLTMAADRVRALVLAAPVPKGVEAAITDAYRELGDRAAVAVRSSDTVAAGMPPASGGMNETYLNLRGSTAVLGAVRRCWASLFGPRSIVVRAKWRLPAAEADIAVVVQRQVDATRAGVIDTSVDDGRLLRIEAVYGLGESLASACVPDRYLVDRTSGRIAGHHVRPQQIAVELATTGGTRSRAGTEAEALRPVLADAEITALATLARAIEDHEGASQRVEWALDGAGDAWVLQTHALR